MGFEPSMGIVPQFVMGLESGESICNVVREWRVESEIEGETMWNVPIGNWKLEIGKWLMLK